MLRGERWSALKAKVKEGRTYPMRRSDLPLPRGKEYGAEIKMHGEGKGRMGQGQVVEEAGIPRHMSDKRHVRETGGRIDGLSVPKHLLLREIGGSKTPRRARPVTWEMELKLREFGRSASRGLARAADGDHAGRRGNGSGLR